MSYVPRGNESWLLSQNRADRTSGGAQQVTQTVRLGRSRDAMTGSGMMQHHSLAEMNVSGSRLRVLDET